MHSLFYSFKFFTSLCSILSFYMHILACTFSFCIPPFICSLVLPHSCTFYSHIHCIVLLVFGSFVLLALLVHSHTRFIRLLILQATSIYMLGIHCFTSFFILQAWSLFPICLKLIRIHSLVHSAFASYFTCLLSTRFKAFYFTCLVVLFAICLTSHIPSCTFRFSNFI